MTSYAGSIAPKNAGTYIVTAAKAADCTYQAASSVAVSFTISPKTLTAGMVGSIDAQTYSGSAVRPTVTVTDGSTTLVKGTDYTLSYSENTGAATGTATIVGMGN